MRAPRALCCAMLLGGLAVAGTWALAPGPARARPEDGPRGDAAAAWRTRRPAASIVLVGAQRGRLNTCGCTVPQLGGLERLAALMDELRPRATAPQGFSALSLGGTMAGRLEEQEETKAMLYRATLQDLGFSALLLGTSDLLVSAMCRPFPGAGLLDEPRPPANVHLASVSPARQTQPFADVEVGGVRLRAASFVDPEEGQRLVADGLAEHFSSVPSVLEGMQPRPDVLWLIAAHVSGVELEALRSGLPRLGPGIVVDLTRSTGARSLDDARLETGIGHPPLVVTFDDLGTDAGVLDLDPLPEGGGWKVSFHAVPLVPALEETGSPSLRRTEDLMSRYRQEVRDLGYLERFETIPFAGGGLQYVGSGACARCHPGIYEEWVNSSHAIALRTLVALGYQWDPECIRCHVVGFERSPDGRWRRTTSGFRHPERTQHLGGVGCESCHGPGSAHVEKPYDRDLWAPGRPNQRIPGLAGCVRCHDPENSHGFTEAYEASLLPRVDHRGVDPERRTVHRAPPRPGAGRDGR